VLVCVACGRPRQALLLDEGAAPRGDAANQESSIGRRWEFSYSERAGLHGVHGNEEEEEQEEEEEEEEEKGEGEGEGGMQGEGSDKFEASGDVEASGDEEEEDEKVVKEHTGWRTDGKQLGERTKRYKDDENASEDSEGDEEATKNLKRLQGTEGQKEDQEEVEESVVQDEGGGASMQDSFESYESTSPNRTERRKKMVSERESQDLLKVREASGADECFLCGEWGHGLYPPFPTTLLHFLSPGLLKIFIYFQISIIFDLRIPLGVI